MMLAPSVRISSYIRPKLLHRIKGILVYNGILRILKDYPVIFRYIMALFVLKVLLRFEVYGMS